MITFHPTVCSLVDSRLVKDHFIGPCVITQDQPEVLGSVGMIVVAHANDRWHASSQILVQVSELQVQQLLSIACGYDIPNVAGSKANATESRRQLVGMAAAAQLRIYSRLVEDIVLIHRLAQLR